MAELLPLLFDPVARPRPHIYVLGRSEEVQALGDLENLDPAIDCHAWPLHQALPGDARHVVVLWHPSLATSLASPRYPPILLCGQHEGVPIEIAGVPTVRLVIQGSRRAALLQLLMCTVLSTAYKGMIGVDDADVALLLRRGGIARIYTQEGLTLRHAAQGLRRKTHRVLRAMAPNAALCLTLCAPAGPISLRAIEVSLAWVLETAPPESEHVVALLASPQKRVNMRLLAINPENA